MNHVPYKGAAPAVTDLLAGRIQVWIGAANSLLPHIRAGKLRLLATAASQRFGEVPDVPTVAEAGIPGFSLYPWISLSVPARTPPELIAKVNSEVNRILGLPEVRARLVPQGIDLSTGSPEDLASLIREDHARWGRVIREAGVKEE
jgi:tripartite-type tricarboxylate transporter receptor subunit TctC